MRNGKMNFRVVHNRSNSKISPLLTPQSQRSKHQLGHLPNIPKSPSFQAKLTEKKGHGSLNAFPSHAGKQLT